MINGRETIMAALDRSLKDRQAGDDPLDADPVHAALSRDPPDHARRVDTFRAKAEAVDATTRRLAGPSAVPGEITDYLARSGLGGPLRMAPHPMIQGLDWSVCAGLEVTGGAARDGDRVGLGVAYAVIAETGTLVLNSAPESPTSLNFLPEIHIVLLPAGRILDTGEDLWSLMRREKGKENFLPPSVNWITGPSRTADIEQRLQLGVHGPRHLHILIVDHDDG